MHDLPDSVDPATLAGGLLDLLQTAGVLACLKDAGTGSYGWANARYAEFVQRPAAELRGLTDLDLLPLADATLVRAADQRALGVGLPSAGEHRFERQGAKLDFRTLRIALPVSTGQPWLLNLWWDESATRRDAQQLQTVLQQLERQQSALEQAAAQQREGRDRPTELFRSDQFEEHLKRELALSMREHREFALVLMAIDAASAWPADGGLQTVVASIGQMLRSNTRAMDVISRLGDGQFGILLSGVGLATAHTRMEQLRRQCATHVVVHHGHAMNFTISAGVASFPHTASTLDELSRAAQRSLSDAVARGGNRVSLAAISLDARMEPR